MVHELQLDAFTPRLFRFELNEVYTAAAICQFNDTPLLDALNVPVQLTGDTLPGKDAVNESATPDMKK